MDFLDKSTFVSSDATVTEKSTPSRPQSRRLSFDTTGSNRLLPEPSVRSLRISAMGTGLGAAADVGGTSVVADDVSDAPMRKAVVPEEADPFDWEALDRYFFIEFVDPQVG